MALNAQFVEPRIPRELDEPLYGTTFRIAVRRAFRKYTVFYGRASRSEFWWWALLIVAGALVFAVASVALGGRFDDPSGLRNSGAGDLFTTFRGTPASPWLVTQRLLYILWGFMTFLPTLALIVRRLHDGNHSGWWFWITAIPGLGAIVLLVLLAGGSRPSGSRFY